MSRLAERHAKVERGFALVLTLALLALLVLAVLALSALVRTSAHVADGGARQVQARQNAQLALALALGDLQTAAGDDTRITGMAGIAGVPPGLASTTRHWCGVWRADGSFVRWLTSGANADASLAGRSVELVGAGSVSHATTFSANQEKEPVVAGLVALPSSADPVAPRGDIAYIVLDEGVKLSAYAPVAERAEPALAPAIGSTMLLNQRKLRTAIETHAAALPKVWSFEQLALLPVPAAAPLTPSVLQDTFHYVTLTSRVITASGQLQAGAVNINTTSALVWRSLLDLYTQTPGAVGLSDSAIDTRGNALANGLAASGDGKASGGPFTSLDGLLVYLEASGQFPKGKGPAASQVVAALAPILAIRSDTFRIRAYGDVTNPVSGAREASACCEAIVQRTPAMIDGIMGRRFVVTYFRWLEPDEI